MSSTKDETVVLDGATSTNPGTELIRPFALSNACFPADEAEATKRTEFPSPARVNSQSKPPAADLQMCSSATSMICAPATNTSDPCMLSKVNEKLVGMVSLLTRSRCSV